MKQLIKKKLVQSFCFCERYAEGVFMSKMEFKLSRWLEDSQEFRGTDWVSFSERIVGFVLDS